MKNKRLILILASIAVLLVIPLIAILFTSEVHWTLSDFVIMGVLLLTTGFSCEIVLRKVSKPEFRIAICIAIIAIFLVIWAQLAIGII